MKCGETSAKIFTRSDMEPSGYGIVTPLATAVMTCVTALLAGSAAFRAVSGGKA